MSDKLPDNFTRIGREESFRFSCHPGIACFTECCRELDLALTPYDVLRLRKRLSMDSAAFMERYVIIEQNPDLILPQCYLTMVDDGWASCVFVSPAGCTVYPDRPSACRAYPVGRGAALSADGTVQETFVLVREEHCRGFAESEVHNPNEYFSDQGLHDYNRFNDALLAFRQHPALKKGHPLSPGQTGQYLLALYNPDSFRRKFKQGGLSLKRSLSEEERQGLAGDDGQLLLLGISWLRQELFGE